MTGAAGRGSGRGQPARWLAIAAAIAALAPSAAGQVALRRDHPDLTFADLASRSPAALGDALLAPGHPPIVRATRLPEGLAPPLPPGSPVRLWVRLTAAAALDRASGFCVRRSWDVTTVARGTPGRDDAIEPQTRYALPVAGGCDGERRRFFAVIPADRPRAFAVVRLLAAAAASARGPHPPRFPVTIDDAEGREMTAYRSAHPDPTVPPITIFTDPRVALSALPVAEIAYVGHLAADADLLAPAPLHDPDGRPRERWKLFLGGDWTVDLVLDGNRIGAIALRRAIPPPF